MAKGILRSVIEENDNGNYLSYTFVKSAPVPHLNSYVYIFKVTRFLLTKHILFKTKRISLDL